MLPDSLIYLRSNWRQAICPWEILRSWACVTITEAVVQRCSVEKLFSKKFSKLTGKSCARFSFSIKLQAEVCNFVLKETRAQSFSCKFCAISKNNFFYRIPPAAASAIIRKQISRARCRHILVLVTLRKTHQLCFLYWKLFLLNSWKISGKLPITESNFTKN